VKARAGVIKAGIIFDDECLSNIVDDEAFFGAQKVMNDILEEAIVEVAEYLEDEERNKRAEAARNAKMSVAKRCLCIECSIHECPRHRDPQ